MFGELRVQCLLHGGYIVSASPVYLNGEPQGDPSLLAAFTDLDDALAFVKDNLPSNLPRPLSDKHAIPDGE